MNRYLSTSGCRFIWMRLIWFCLIMLKWPALAEDSLCQSVQLEIIQNLTLERQAFEATLRINNGYDDAVLSNVTINLQFSDANNQPVSSSSDTNDVALFYVKPPVLTDIDAIDNGTIQEAKSAIIKWLIIPVPGAANSNSAGTVYNIGARLAYWANGQEQLVDVQPDSINVRPLPSLQLHYFLPGDVYGDDPFTQDIEPPIAFSLGLRIKNIGYGAANQVRIDSGQPQITANSNGLLVAFAILTGDLHGRSTGKSLLLNYGSLAAQESIMGRWVMTASLCGRFTNFSAAISHDDELGGRLTSLIQATNMYTHLHLHDVLVDLPDRDRVRDFLTSDYVYESDGEDSPVSNLSDSVSFAGTGGQYTLMVSNTPSGFFYIRTQNPLGGQDMVVKQVTRSDGKRMDLANVWLSKTRDGSDPWQHFFQLFDAGLSNRTQTYFVVFENSANANSAPVLHYIGPRTAYAGQNLMFAVSAYDPDGHPLLSTGPLPANASLTNNVNSSAVFSWTPSATQIGQYRIKFMASDGLSGDSEYVTLNVKEGCPARYPEWWDACGAIATNAEPNDYAFVNLGQVHNLAVQAYRLFTNLPGGAGFDIQWSSQNDFSAVNIGQLKQISTGFYDQLYSPYPWLGGFSTNDYAIANIGQVKNLFSFNPLQDSDFDGMPDWWEMNFCGSATELDPDADPNTNEVSNLREYLRNTNPL